ETKEEPAQPEEILETPTDTQEITPPSTAPTPETPTKLEPEHINIVIDKINSVKIIDKIDLSQFEKKPKQKENKIEIKKAETKAETKKNDQETKPTAISPTEPAHEKLQLVVEKLKSPKIMGKIDLSTIKESSKKDNSAQANDAKKKKRKRIKPSAIKSGGKSDDGQKLKKTEVKIEISEEDIQRQIKETMMRLEPLGKTKSAKRRREKRQHNQEEHRELEKQELQQQKILKVTEFITANELATLMNVSVTQIISTCMTVGLFVSINQRLGAETISLLAEEFGYEVEFVGVDIESEASQNQEADKEEDLRPRHPIITVMGHVDHGKTSLLDYIRKANVIAGEAGGITQHIGAYEVTLPDGRKITFLDTPGHEAFTAMRARGAKITDLCIIVIAADDSIMPQTIEAINHSQAAGVPMVFAITKIDKPHANPEKIKEGLANMNILVEEWGGTYQCQEIDAKHGTNVNELLEKVLLEAEMLELKANPNRPGSGTVIESLLDKGKGYVAKVLVQNGTLKMGDTVLAGSCFGKVKALYNERNQHVNSIGPASPVALLGLDGAPQAGDLFKVCESDHEARTIATKRARLVREMGLRTQKHITLDEIGRRIAIGDFKELNVIVKGDVDGSVEALSDSLMKLSTEQVQVNVIHKSVGQVTESDVLLASASNAIIVAFQVRPSSGARKLAEKEQIDVRTYSIIYAAIDEVKASMEGMLAPKIREKILCNIEIKEVFKITKVGNIAGCMVLDGKIQRNTKIRLIRDGIVIYTGKLGSLRRFKDDVKEVMVGQDCGLNIENFNDIKIGDIVEGYEEYEEKPTL
ncbi:MAG TPA: translation initiation factor IF-2, partial [Bacteroidales bacterium]|nr:translation initiation factor IF-2 [Bacteroidales bacterium]HPT52879.1 translation initiation factor IF-2 [Bacteroidales bacterium]